MVYNEGGVEVLHYGTVQCFYSVVLDSQPGNRIRVKLADITFFRKHPEGRFRKEGVFFDKIDQTKPFTPTRATNHIVDVASIKGKVVFMSDSTAGEDTFVGEQVKN